MRCAARWTAAGFVAVCALAVLLFDRPASAETAIDVPHSAYCAFPGQDIVEAGGYAVRLPMRWWAYADGQGGLVVDGDPGEQL